MKKLIPILSMLFLMTVAAVAQPTILNISPSQNGIDVSNTSQVSIQFSEDMNTSTVNSNTVVVYGSQRGLYSGSYSFPVNFATNFNADSTFLPGEVITVIITTGIQNSSNTAMASPYIWSFTTEVEDGNGIFEAGTNYSAGDAPEDIVLADFDNDGFTDIAVGNSGDANVSIFINDGDGTYASAVNYSSGGTNLRALTAGDLDDDGFVDLVVANNLISGSANVKVLINDGDGTFTSDGDYGNDSYLPQDLNLADIDGDGDLDLVATYDFDDFAGRMFNDGSGVFSSLGLFGAGSQPVDVQVGDIDGDNDIDMVVTNVLGDNISILANSGTGSFVTTNKSVGDSPRASALGDFDGDGDLDIATINHNDDNVSVYLNQDAANIDFSFTFPTNYSTGSFPIGITSADVDADGDLDLLTTNTGEDSVEVLSNNGSGVFSSSGKFATGDAPRSIAAADLENNDNLDLVVVNNTDDNISVLKTAGPPSITAVSNRNGTSISASANLTATFSGSLDATSVADTSVIVYGSKSGSVDGAISYDDPSKTITFNPTTDFKVGEEVTMILSSGIKSNLGVNFLGYTFSYTVATSGNGNVQFGDTLNVGSSGVSEFIAADVDGDGDEDLITRNLNAGNLVVYKNASGTYSEFSTTAFSSIESLYSGDFDNDGDVDVLIKKSSDNEVIAVENDGSGNFTLRDTTTITSSGASSFIVEDFDNDGNLDFYFRYGATLNRVYWGNGDFSFPSSSFPSPDFSFDRISSGDVDNDGDIDILGFDGNNSRMQVFLNNGDRSFSGGDIYSDVNTTSSRFNYFGETADLNADGYVDVIVPNSDGFQLLLNDGDGTFGSPISYPTGDYDLQSVNPFDYDGDGDIDLSFQAENDPEGTEHLFFAYNDGTGGFGNQDLFMFNSGSPDFFSDFDNDYTVTDYDDDGDLDIVGSLRKNGFTTSHYIAVAENAAGASGTAPTVAASNVSFSAITANSAKVSWTNGDGSRRLVVVKEGSAVDATPVDDTGYQPNPAFGSGTELGTENFAVFGGPTSEVIVSGLTAETEYHVQVFELNGLPGAEKFYTTSAPVGNFTTSPPPTIWSKNDATTTFTKANFADHTLAANQDRITDLLWFTRADEEGLFNAALATEWNGSESPVGTMWALGTTDDISSLSFDTFKSTLDDNIGDNIEDADMVVYVEDYDLYFDINFSSWTNGRGDGGGGGFSYTRSTGTLPDLPETTFQDSAGFAIEFDGGNTKEEYLTLETDEDVTPNFTVEMWVKPSQLNTDQVFMVFDRDEVLMGIDASNQFYASHEQDNVSGGGGEGEEECAPFCGESEVASKAFPDPVMSSSPVSITGTETATLNEWSHVALVGESGNGLFLYVNGVFVDSTSLENGTSDGSRWYVGNNNNSDKPFNGAIDEIRIWKTARTQSQIRSFLYRPYEGATNALVGYWQLNEGSGSTSAETVNNYDADLNIGNGWIASDAPIGEGTVEETTNFQTGTVSVGNAALDMGDGFDNPVDVQVTEVTGNPNQFPAGFTSGLGGKYFVINLFGDPGTFSANLTLTYGSGVITAAQQSNPGQLKLYKRSSNSTGAWTEIASASSANATTGVVTWNGITSFSQFMAVNDEPSLNIQIADGTDIISFNDSTYTFADSLFDLEDGFKDSLLTINSNSTLTGTLYLDQNTNGVYDAGTDSLLTADKELSYTPSGTIKLRYTSATPGVESATIKLQYNSLADSVSLDFATVEGDPSIAGNTGENGWYLLSNPITTTIGELLSNVWTQGAINSNAPTGDATLYTFNEDSSKYVAVTTDLDTTKLSAGQGLLAFLYEDDDLGDGQSDIDGGWPKTLYNYGAPFGTDINISARNVNHDGVSGTSGSEGFALLGNPYGWSLSADSVISTLKREDPLANSYVYRWNAVEKTYQILSSGSINPYEAVFVRILTSGTTADLSFDYDDAVGVLAKEQKSDLFELNVVHSESDVSSKFHLRNGKNAKEGIDPYDAYYLGTYARNYSNLYSLIEDQPLSINNIPLAFDGEIEVPLYMDATLSGDFILNWDSELIPEEWTIVLENSSTGELISMNELNSYSFPTSNRNKSVTDFSNNLFSSDSKNKNGESKISQQPLLIMNITSSLSVGTEDELGIPNQVELYQNYPNPFNPSSVIRFGVPTQSKVKLEVFDILGRKVATLINGDIKPAGRYNIQFSGDNLASGMYLYRLSVGNSVMIKKMTLIK